MLAHSVQTVCRSEQWSERLNAEHLLLKEFRFLEEAGASPGPGRFGSEHHSACGKQMFGVQTFRPVFRSERSLNTPGEHVVIDLKPVAATSASTPLYELMKK